MFHYVSLGPLGWRVLARSERLDDLCLHATGLLGSSSSQPHLGWPGLSWSWMTWIIIDPWISAWMGIHRMIAVFDWRLIQNGGAGSIPSIPTSCIHLYSFRAISCKYHWISIGDSCFSDLFSSWAVVNLRSRGSIQGPRVNGAQWLKVPIPACWATAARWRKLPCKGGAPRGVGMGWIYWSHLKPKDWTLDTTRTVNVYIYICSCMLTYMCYMVNVCSCMLTYMCLKRTLPLRIREFKKRKHRCNRDFSPPGSVVHPSWECFYCWRWGWVGSQGRWFGDFWKSYQKSSHPGGDYLDDILASPILSSQDMRGLP